MGTPPPGELNTRGVVKYSGFGPIDLDCILPQVSSLGPLKYVLYASGLHELTGRFGIKMHSFADDIQLSRHLLVKDIDSGKRDMAAAIAAISSWSRSY